MTKLVDAYGRRIDYLRISVTDHCNLRCHYCTPFSGRDHQSRSGILSYEELLRITEAAVAAGITKIRITGGEPLVRRGVVGFLGGLSQIAGLKALALTTNGVFLAEMAEDLYRAGVSRVNVSLDSLNPKRFTKITGQPLQSHVLAGIHKAEAVGMYPIKINTVVMRGINDDEVEAIARLTLHNPYHVRFIELMPTEGWASDAHTALFVPIEEIMKKIATVGDVQILPASDSYGPAKLCALSGAKGKIGFIAPVTRHFCGTCNRLRLTADGKLRACLFSKNEIDLKGPLRKGASRASLVEIFRQAVARKPHGYSLSEAKAQGGFGRAMRAIGG